MLLLPIIAEQNSGSYFKNLLEKRNQRQPIIKILSAYQRGRLYDAVTVYSNDSKSQV